MECVILGKIIKDFSCLEDNNGEEMSGAVSFFE